MSETDVLVERDARGVLRVWLNRAAKHNAFDDRIIAELNQILDQYHNDDGLRALVLGSEGRSFSAGADLGWMQRMAKYGYEENLKDAEALAELLHGLATFPVPTIARVQGAAFGGGVGLVACCDMAVASERASFMLSEVRIGLIPATISPYVVAAIGERASRRYFTTAEQIDAATALRLGLVCEVVAEDQLDAAIDGLVGKLLENGPLAVRGAKHLVADVAGHPVNAELMRDTSERIALIRVSEEGQEGLQAFLEKRVPSWRGDGEP